MHYNQATPASIEGLVVTRLDSPRLRRRSKEHLSHSRDENERVIIVAPPDVSRRLARAAPADQVIMFDSLDDLDHWRKKLSAAESIAEDVAAVLAESGRSLAAVPRKLRDALE